VGAAVVVVVCGPEASPMITIEKLEAQRKVLVEQLKSKLEADDLHGVQDAASDIREIDAMLLVLKEVQRD
jgi:hypothetical protein